jgi:hypothetical protein
MAAMETDARERAERRKIKEKEANILKETTDLSQVFISHSCPMLIFNPTN